MLFLFPLWLFHEHLFTHHYPTLTSVLTGSMGLGWQTGHETWNSVLPGCKESCNGRGLVPFLATLSLMAAQHLPARLGRFSSSPLKHHKSAAPALCLAELWRLAEKSEGLLCVLRGCFVEASRFDWKKFRVD